MKNLLADFVPLAVTGLTPAGASAAPAVGEAAPDFELPYATREAVASDRVTLSAFRGRSRVILAFYPADWSGGCTKEVCTLRDHFAALGELAAEVIAISGDYVYSHHAWAKHHDLPFRLAADHDHAVARRYASYNAESGMDRRTVFLVDREGKVAYVDLAYSAKDSTSFDQLVEVLRAQE
jgi:peroxiredoxin